MTIRIFILSDRAQVLTAKGSRKILQRQVTVSQICSIIFDGIVCKKGDMVGHCTSMVDIEFEDHTSNLAIVKRSWVYLKLFYK